MSFLLLSFTVSLLSTLAVLRSNDRHGSLSADTEISGPQKFHSRPVPRIGGVGVLLAMFAGAVLAQFTRPAVSESLWLLLAAGLPAFIGGFAEDLTKKVSASRRLIAAVISAALAVWLLESVVRHTAIPGVDPLIRIEPFAVALTLLVVTGVSNSINIIDGFNGLASMCVLIMLMALAYVALQVQDRLVLTAALISAGAVLGFFVWNFPGGLIFLGDGGAYLLGFMVAELGVLLIVRNADVSPLFPLLMCAYPIFETLFSMYRRKVLKGVASSQPDGIHMHTLIHRRLVRQMIGETSTNRLTARNSMTSPYLWLLCSLSAIPAVLWWRNTAVLTGFLVLFMVSYVVLYWRIVRFKVPRWLLPRR
jgi:UDP-N-acetylmuramyl pentapeptide phosphotransferase/UDP-N-acetylglucosamine-1-phosphate transferase